MKEYKQRDINQCNLCESVSKCVITGPYLY